ncbi:MAG: GAF domain-containing protein [Ignavibacteriaceae bacterium]
MIQDNDKVFFQHKIDKYEYLLSHLSDFFQIMDADLLSFEIYKASELSVLANFTALLKEMFESFSWVGFYILYDDVLFLGPFQGRVACDRIALGDGVCGTAAELMETLVIPDVHKFEGHIACDTSSNSEIVVPIFNNGIVWGVLDIDSTKFDNFDESDKFYLEKIVNLLFEIIK